MGQRIHVELFDDLEPEVPATHTDEILWNGKPLEIDLCQRNHDALVALLKPYVKVARRKGSASTPTSTAAKSPSKTPEGRQATKERTEIRKWARRNGYPDLGSNGRIAAVIVKDFHDHAGKDKPKLEDPDPAPSYPDFASYPTEEQAEMKAWVVELGLKWPRAAVPRNRIAVEAWGDRNETLAKEILEGYAP